MAHCKKERRNEDHNVNFGEGHIDTHLLRELELQMTTEERLDSGQTYR